MTKLPKSRVKTLADASAQRPRADLKQLKSPPRLHWLLSLKRPPKIFYPDAVEAIAPPSKIGGTPFALPFFMGILGWILFGFVVGLIARAIMPGRDPMGLIGTTVLGILGALIAGWLGQALGLYGSEDGAGFVAATLGAIIVLAIYNAFVRKRLVARRRPLERPPEGPGSLESSWSREDRDRKHAA